MDRLKREAIAEALAIIIEQLRKHRHEWYSVEDCDEIIALMVNPASDIRAFIWQLHLLDGDDTLDKKLLTSVANLVDIIDTLTEQAVLRLFAA